MSSFTFLTGTEGCTTNKLGPIADNETGKKSFCESYGSLAMSDGRIEMAEICAIMIV